MTRDQWRAWSPEIAVAAAVVLIGAAEWLSRPVLRDEASFRGGAWFVVLFLPGLAAVVALARRFPGWALAGCWALGLLQLSAGFPLTTTELVLVWPVLAAARWGSTTALVLAGVSVPAAALLAVTTRAGVYTVLPDGLPLSSLTRVLDSFPLHGLTFRALEVLVLLVVGSVPWLVGLALRFSDRARSSAAGEETATAQAAHSLELVRLREEQARLARDVHDVVGHSLTVILSQAESAQYLPDDATTLKRTLATIASSARDSLTDVRSVLAATGDATRPVDGRDVLTEVVQGARSSGVEVHDHIEGLPQALPPELAEVARRVLQEMLTNAIRHGRRGTPVTVERHWADDLRLEVGNAATDAESLDLTQPIRTVEAEPRAGSGIDGMRARLEAVGGRLDVRRRGAGEDQTFTVTAWVPLRPGGAR